MSRPLLTRGFQRGGRGPGAEAAPGVPAGRLGKPDRWGVAALLAGVAAVGCVSDSISREELPAQPIALVFWEPEDARRRAEVLAPTEDTGPAREGVARVEGLAKMLGVADARQWRELSRYAGHLSLLDPRTLELLRVEAAPAGARPMAWSSDHRKLLLASPHRGNRPQLYEYDLESRELRAVTYGDVAHPYGDYAADGGIGFAALSLAEAEPRIDLLLAEPGGGSPRLLVSEELAQSMRISPGGEVAVYVRRRSGEARGRARSPAEELLLLPLEAPEGEALEPRLIGPGRHPAFSPDGQWIVYSALSRGTWRLRRVRVDGSARSPLGRGGIRDEKWPAVSPDGRYVAYVGESGGIDRLFVRRFDGSGDRILLDDGAVAQPVW